MIKNWFKIYVYHLFKNKIYFFLTMLSLAIGIAAVLLSVIHYQEEARYDQWNPNKNNIFVAESRIEEDLSWMKLPSPFGTALKENSPHVVDVCYLGDYGGSILFYKDQKKPVQKILFTQSNFFDFFPFEFVKGNRAQAFAMPNSAVVKDTYAAYLFGDKDPIGEVFSIGEDKYIVSGVYTLGNERSSYQTELIINNLDKRVQEGVENQNWGNHNYVAWIKLDDPAYKKDIEQLMFDVRIEYQFKPIAKEKGITTEELMKEWGMENKMYYLHDLAGQRMIANPNLNGTEQGAASVQRMYIMMGLSVLILILSVFNYINLTTARAMGRGKEVGIRKTLGAGKFNLACQGMFEALLTSLLSMLIALMLAEITLPWMQVFFSSKMELNFWEFLPLILVILVLIVLLVGIIPALFTASFKTLEVLKGQIGRSKKGTGFKNAILIIQFGVACFFMIGAYIVYQQVNYMLNKDLGFKGDQVVRIGYYYKGKREDKVKVYESVKEQFLKVKGVEGVTTAAIQMGSGNGASSSFVHNGNNVQAVIGAMDYNFLEVFEVDLKEGRQLTESLASDSINNILLNETAVRMMQEPDVLGKQIAWNDDTYNVVGVVKDFNLYGLQANYPPIIFLSLKTQPWAGENIQHISVKIKGENIEQTIKELEAIWKQRDISDVPFDYSFVDQDFARTFTNTIQERNVFLVLNSIVIFIALFGLYSLASFTINTRLKEVAIRKVLGASTPELLKQLSKQYVVFCFIGFVIAVFPSYYFLNQWLSDYAFRIDVSVLPFIVCLVVILGLTLLIVLLKAYAATQLSILKYIKYE